jgi:hypothetical protein
MFNVREWNPVVDQDPGVEFLSVELVIFIVVSEVPDNPNTAGKPWSINHFLVFYKCYSHKSML